LKEPSHSEGIFYFTLTMTERPKKKVSESRVEMTQVVMPIDTNYLGNLAGGRLMHWMDLAAAIAASRHANAVAVTASVDTLVFKQPIKLGEVVIIKASVNRAFNTSMEVGVKVFSENLLTGKVVECNKAYFTFVALDANNQRISVPEIVPETDDEKRRYEKAAERRAQRLSLK
jgi:acyl-CoA hydrolase